MSTGCWLEIEIDSHGEQVRISARGSRGERPPPYLLALDQPLNILTTFATKVGRAIRARKELDPATIEHAQAIHAALVKDELRDILVRLTDPSRPREDGRDNRLLIRFFVSDRALTAVPWEALCKPGTTENFWGTDPRVLFTRGVHSSDPWVPREIPEAVRILTIAPGSDEQIVTALQAALAPNIDVGEIEWLDPIIGSNISPKVLYDRLRRGKTPHIVHWIGHGGIDVKGRPSLRLADDEDGEEVWITAEALGRELSPLFYEELRLVVLEACEGAKAGMLGSAAEELAKTGADAVVAHLWPVRADTARTCSMEIYRALTSSNSGGDIGASIAAARRILLATSAEAFSPILFLRASNPILFDFSRRKIKKPTDKRPSKGLAPALQNLLDKPAYSLVIGDLYEDHAVLRSELARFMTDNGDPLDTSMPLSTMTQRCVLRFGEEVMQSLFQQVIGQSPPEMPPLLAAIGAIVPPGVHLTLLWRSYLERAIADAQPGRTIYAIQVAMMGNHAKPRVLKRAAGTKVWKMEPILPKRFDFAEDIVILRMLGGYSPETQPIFTPPVLTEDDHIQVLHGKRPPQWIDELVARTRIQSALFLGLSVLDWRTRLLLRWLYDGRPAPNDSLAVLPPDCDPNEPAIWDSGGGLPGTARIAAIQETLDDLTQQLERYVSAGVRS